MMEREEEDFVGVAAARAGEGEDGGVERHPFVCCICLEPWTCYDAHRICCIPCGQVYGRSCLEMWFRRYNEPSAKCPQCGEPFADNKIINLYAPGNLWDGCCRIKELKEFVNSNVHEMAMSLAELESKLRVLELQNGQVRQAIVEFASQCAEMQATHAEDCKLIEQLNEALNKQAKVTEESIQVPQNAVAVVKTEFLSMKEHMERLVEQNATPIDLIRFMEQNSAKLWERIIPSSLQPTGG